MTSGRRAKHERADASGRGDRRGAQVRRVGRGRDDLFQSQWRTAGVVRTSCPRSFGHLIGQDGTAGALTSRIRGRDPRPRLGSRWITLPD